MAQYKLHYFDGRGRGEPIRLILKYAKVNFEDIRYEYKTKEWYEVVQKSMPWGTLPVLEVDGVKLGETLAISRFLARKYGLVGESEMETAKCDEIVDACSDFTNGAYDAFYFEKDEERKKVLQKKVREETFPKYANKLEQILEKNGSFLVGKKITFADILWADIFQALGDYFGFDLKLYPLLNKHQELILGQPGIKEWIAERPSQPF